MPPDDANPWDDPDPTTTDPAPERAAASPRPAPGADASAGEAEARTETPPPHAPTAADDDGEADRRRVLIIAAVALVLIAAAAFLLTRGDDDDTATDSPVTTRSSPGGAGGVGGAGGAITIAGTADAFDRDDTDDGLGTLPNGAEWVVQSGSWAIRSGAAVVAQPETERRNTAFVATGYPDPQAEVRLPTIANGAGLVFRYQGECNFWAVYAVPEFATWNVEKVVDCERVGGEGDSPVYRAITGAPVADGTKVGVVLSGDQVQIVLNGTVALTFDDPDLAGVGKVGLTTRGADDVAFDDFVAGGPGGQGIVGTAPDGETPTTAAESGPTTTAAEAGG